MKNKFICRNNCFASQSPTPSDSPRSRRRVATPPTAFHAPSSSPPPHNPHPVNISRVKTRRAHPDDPPSDAGARAARNASRIAAGDACSTPTSPAECHFVSVAAVESRVAMNACFAFGHSITSRVRSCRPATSLSVRTMTGDDAAAAATAAATSRGTTW